MKVAVITGEMDPSVQISRKAGERISAALAGVEDGDYDVRAVDASEDVVAFLRSWRPDVALVAAEGQLGQDGSIQGLLEMLGIAYIGSDSGTCRDAWDKASLPVVMRAYGANEGGLMTASWPAGFALTRGEMAMGLEGKLSLLAEDVLAGYPLCVKPAHGAYGRGVLRVESEDELKAALAADFERDDTVLVQEWVEGVILHVCVIGTGWDAYALPPVEAVPAGTVPDKPDERLVQMVAPVRPASLSNEESDAQAIRAEIERAALEVYRAFGVRDLGCVDMIWDGAQARAISVNVAPSLLESSPFSLALQASGISFEGLLERLVDIHG